MEAVFNVVQDRSGRAIAGATVAVYNPLGVLAALFSDNGVTPRANPTMTNEDGEYWFYAANDTYSIEITAPGFTGQSITGIVLFDQDDLQVDLQGTGLDGDTVGFRSIPPNIQNANYTTVADDSGKTVLTATAAVTLTIAANVAVPYPIGTAITFVNTSAGNVSIAINSDTLTLAGSTTVGTRTLARNGVATALKVGATSWLISGTGVT